MNVVAIVQARMGSSRLPGKVLLSLHGEPMLARVINRLRRAAQVDSVLVATTTAPGDDPIVEWCHAARCACFRGSEENVLERYVLAARGAKADAIVRVTSDCPLIDPGVVDEVVGHFLAGQPGLDYVCNFYPLRTYPRGLDAEVFQRTALERVFRDATDQVSREHVTAYFYHHPEQFHLGAWKTGEDQSHHRWTVDTPEDFALIEDIYVHFGHDHFTWREALAVVEAHPQWSARNQHIEQKPLIAPR